MHVALHFPFADVRRYAPDAPVPEWPLNARAFVRGFGRAHDQSERDRTTRYPAEGPYCDAKRIIRFEPGLRQHSLGNNGAVIEPYCAHRRLMGDKQGAMRLEVGIGTYAHTSPRNIDGDALVGVLERTFDLRVSVRTPDGRKTMGLARADISVARAFLAATTPRGGPAPQRWWVTQGKPLCVVMYDPETEVASLPHAARAISSVDKPLPTSIAHLAVEHRGVNLRALFVAVPKDKRSDRTLAQLRGHLARVHTERECLKEVLRLIDVERLVIDGNTPSRKRLQDYLQAVFSRLTRQSFEGLPQESLARAMEDDYDAITEEQRDRIMQRLANARPAVVRDAAAALATGAGVTTNYFAERIIVSNGGIIGGSGNQVVNVDRGASIHGPIVNGAIRDSFNTIEKSGASSDLKNELTNLATLVAQLAEQLDKDRATEVTRDLKALTEEATSPAPRRKWYELSSAGLLDAAKFVGDFAGKIGTSLAAVTKLLAFGA